MYKDVWAKEINNIGIAVNAAWHFGHACHRFVNPTLSSAPILPQQKNGLPLERGIGQAITIYCFRPPLLWDVTQRYIESHLRMFWVSLLVLN